MINRDIVIRGYTTIYEAMLIMEKREKRLLIICDEDDVFEGLISIGDIQRAVLSKTDLSQRVMASVRKDILVANEKENYSDIKESMLRERIECMPVVDSNNILIDTIEWSDVCQEQKKPKRKDVKCPVLIMAGGEGIRMRPLTAVLPKPLLPVSKKTIIENIIDFFEEYGCRRFYISTNYMADKIEAHIQKIDNKSLKITCVKEDKKMGTVGALYYLKNINETFIVSNCDILMNIDLNELLDFHYSNKNIMTIVSVVKSYSSPYGVLEISKGGELDAILEKPTILNQINAGLYVLEPTVFDYFKKEEYKDIIGLITEIQEDKKKIGVYPVLDNQWSDLGSWEGYLKYCNISIFSSK